MVKIGQFRVEEISSTGTRPDLGISRPMPKEMQILTLNLETLTGHWGNTGLPIDKEVLLGGHGHSAAEESLEIEDLSHFLIQETIDPILAENFERVLKRIFGRCERHVRRQQRPTFLRWLPV